MDDNKKRLAELKIHKTIEALNRNNMKGFFAKNTEDLYHIIDGLMLGAESVTAGGSMTLYETGVIGHLHERYGEIFTDRDRVSAEEKAVVMRRAFFMDVYFAGTNAVTENGELYNVDGHGNRVSAMIFGPKKVILVAGYNKIVSSLEEAELRVKNIAAPANAIRLGCGTPCAATGECIDCRSERRICCSRVVLGRQSVKDRINVIFLMDEYGY